MIIFLDIDGVLETSGSWKRPEFLSDNFYKFNKVAQRNLIEIIEHYNTEIILTTTHRINFSLQEWKQIFDLRGIYPTKISKINQAKSVTDLKNRNVEIEEWFKNNSVGQFLIIDDDKSLNDLPDKLKKHWIKTDPMAGISNEIKKQIFQLEIDK